MPNQALTTEPPTVVLIHGLAAQAWMMGLLARRIRRAGFRTKLHAYPSMWRSIEFHAKTFAKRLQQLEDDPRVSQFHLVAHSLGSIIIRQMLLDHEFSKLGRIVMLAPPNHGSTAATWLSSYVLPWCKPVRQISDAPDSFVNGLAEPTNKEIGVIAASYDRVVSDAQSRLANQQDHLTLYSGHNGLLVRPASANATIHFLHEGRFDRSSQ